MVGTIASRTTASISPAPPRGITTSTRPRAWIRWVTLDAVRAGQQLHGVLGQALGDQRAAQRGHQRLVGLRRRRTATQQHGIARLERQPERVDGDVGPALVDDADDTERNALLAQLQTVGQCPTAKHLTDRIGQTGHLTQPGGDPLDALRVQRQPVEHRLRRYQRPGQCRDRRRWRRGSRCTCASTASAAACSAASLIVGGQRAKRAGSDAARRAASCTCSRKPEAVPSSLLAHSLAQLIGCAAESPGRVLQDNGIGPAGLVVVPASSRHPAMKSHLSAPFGRPLVPSTPEWAGRIVANS